MALIRSKDRKVTNAVSPNGKTPTIANTFGLPAGKDYSCPNQTPTCAKVCYAGKLEKIYKGVRNVLLTNWDQLSNATSLKQIVKSVPLKNSSAFTGTVISLAMSMHMHGRPLLKSIQTFNFGYTLVYLVPLSF
jgi:hypothetical protein